MLKESKPIIGVVGKIDSASDDDRVVCIWDKVRVSLVKKGAIPILILPNQDIKYYDVRPKEVKRLTYEEKEELKMIVDLCDGIVFQGGYFWYEYESFIYEYSKSKDMPIFGICCGMQMIACTDNDFGVDTTKRNETKIDHHQREKDYVHEVNIIKDTLLYEILKANKIKVNSRHNYHVEKVNKLSVSAYSEDNLIEAIESQDNSFILGVQWHPETMLDYDINANKIFDFYIKKCVEYRYLKLTK